MTAAENLTTRRSIRKYNSALVDEETIRKIVSLASYAPSWKNSQTAGYVVINGSEKVCRFADACFHDRGERNGRIINTAPCVVILTTDDGIAGYDSDGTFSSTKGTHWQSFDAGIAAQTFCLAANEEGLGTLIMGIYDEKLISEYIKLPENKSVSAVIALGYFDEMPVMPKRKSVDELLSFAD